MCVPTEMHGLILPSDATSNATCYHIPPLLCCVVQSRGTVHVSVSLLSPHLQPEGGRGETKEGGEGREQRRRGDGGERGGKWKYILK